MRQCLSLSSSIATSKATQRFLLVPPLTRHQKVRQQQFHRLELLTFHYCSNLADQNFLEDTIQVLVAPQDNTAVEVAFLIEIPVALDTQMDIPGYTDFAIIMIKCISFIKIPTILRRSHSLKLPDKHYGSDMQGWWC